MNTYLSLLSRSLASQQTNKQKTKLALGWIRHRDANLEPANLVTHDLATVPPRIAQCIFKGDLYN